MLVAPALLQDRAAASILTSLGPSNCPTTPPSLVLGSLPAFALVDVPVSCTFRDRSLGRIENRHNDLLDRQKMRRSQAAVLLQAPNSVPIRLL